jgi:hypothetical protein
MCTPSLGMDTTCGSYALKGARALEDAEPIKKLLAAGMIMIGKTNTSVRDDYLVSAYSCASSVLTII